MKNNKEVKFRSDRYVKVCKLCNSSKNTSNYCPFCEFDTDSIFIPETSPPTNEETRKFGIHFGGILSLIISSTFLLARIAIYGNFSLNRDLSVFLIHPYIHMISLIYLVYLAISLIKKYFLN